MSILERFVDERFLAHRRQSTAVAGQVATALAMGLFLWRHYADHVWSWDLFAVGLAFAVVKLGLMAWRLTTIEEGVERCLSATEGNRIA